MKEKNFIKKIKDKINQFFEENEDDQNEEEIDLKTLIITLLVGSFVIMLIYLFTYDSSPLVENDSYKNQKIYDNPAYIGYGGEIEYYFKNEENLKNSDFSEGSNNWVNLESVQIRTNSQEYHSYPKSLQLSCNNPSCTFYYSTKANSKIDQENKKYIWIGTEEDMKMKLSYWYKGSGNEISISKLYYSGDIKNKYMDNGEFSSEWVKKEMLFNIEDEVKAFAISITIGNTGEGYLLIDDIELERLDLN